MTDLANSKSQALVDDLCGLVWDLKPQAKKFLFPDLDHRILDINAPNSKFGE